MTQYDYSDGSIPLDIDRLVAGCLIIAKSNKPLLVIEVRLRDGEFVHTTCLEMGKKNTSFWCFSKNPLVRMVIPE